MTYLISKDLVWTIAVSVIGTSCYAATTHYRVALPEHVTTRKLQFVRPQFSFKILRGALSLACLNIVLLTFSHRLITGQMTGRHPNPVNLNLLTSSQALADLGTSLLVGASRNDYFRDSQRA